MIARFLPFAILLAAITPTPSHAQAYQCSLPRKIEPIPPRQPDGPVRLKPVGRYTLAASWSPEYCRIERNKGTMQCSGQHGRFGFVLHGLWPEAQNGAPPQWCSLTPRPSPELIRRNLCMTPVPSLLEHEWAKHGSCMTRKPETYFKVSAILWQSVQWPDADRLSRKKELTAGDLRDAFLIANPHWKREHIGIERNERGWLRGMRLCYGRDFRPSRCPSGTYGPSDKTPLKIWRGL